MSQMRNQSKETSTRLSPEPWLQGCRSSRSAGASCAPAWPSALLPRAQRPVPGTQSGWG